MAPAQGRTWHVAATDTFVAARATGECLLSVPHANGGTVHAPALDAERPESSAPPLDVLIVSTSYPAGADDWRGLFIGRMVAALSALTDLRVSLWAPRGELPEKVCYAGTPSDARWLQGLVARGGIAQLLRSAPVRGMTAGAALLWRLRRACRASPARIFHVNWLQNALALPDDRRPALITVLGADMRLLGWPGMRPLLRRVCRGRRVAICPNAEWMVPILQQAFGDLAQVQAISFGIDACWYAVERERRAMPSRWLAVTRITRDKIGTLFEWGKRWFSSDRRTLHLFGPLVEPLELPPWVQYHGPATPRVLCEQWFPTAQGLITLSRHAEGRPQVMLEAMAAGLPIVASHTSAHADLLHHGRTGWLAESPEQVEAGLAHLEIEANNRAMGSAARQDARERFGTWDDCARRYRAAYARLLAP